VSENAVRKPHENGLLTILKSIKQKLAVDNVLKKWSLSENELSFVKSCIEIGKKMHFRIRLLTEFQMNGVRG